MVPLPSFFLFSFFSWSKIQPGSSIKYLPRSAARRYSYLSQMIAPSEFVSECEVCVSSCAIVVQRNNTFLTRRLYFFKWELTLVLRKARVRDLGNITGVSLGFSFREEKNLTLFMTNRITFWHPCNSLCKTQQLLFLKY